jgi:hypothetical protein
MSVGKPYRPVKSGQPLTAAGMNRNVVGGLQRGAMFSGNVNRRNFPDGVALDIPGGQAIPGSSVYQKLVEIQTIEDDYYTVLVYNPVSESTDGAEFGVAKTYTQQVSVYPSATESHEVGDIIVALRTTSNVVVGGEHLQWVEAGSGGGGAAIDVVSVFPEIPESAGGRFIRFTGDGGVWEAGVGDTHWYPCSRFTDYEGTPGEDE